MAEWDLTWIHPAFGVDFLQHTDKGARTWLAGGDPYAEKQHVYMYPPIVLRLFEWVGLFTASVSVRIWIVCLAIFAAIGAVAAVSTRQELGLKEIPRSLAAAMILFSLPVLFALDRANYDLLIVPLVVGAVALMRRKTATADVIAALLLAVAIWCKIYPGPLVFGVLALKRWRLATWLAVFGLLIALADPPQLIRYLANNDLEMAKAWGIARIYPVIVAWNHPLPTSWKPLWAGTPLALVPGQLGTALFLGALLLWVTWHLARSPQCDPLAKPYFFWLVALGSFAPPIANDYSLTPLLLAVMSTWNRKDRWFVHVALAASLLWWQPIALPFLSGRIYLFIKLAALMAAGYSVVAHAAKFSKTSSSGAQQELVGTHAIDARAP
jgi:hypothetical protein